MLIELQAPKVSNVNISEVDSILIRSQNSFKKASNVCVDADKKQKEAMGKIQQKVIKLETQNEKLKEVIFAKENEINNIKAIINPIDSGEQFDLFTKD
jgi:hypothetical protein